MAIERTQSQAQAQAQATPEFAQAAHVQQQPRQDGGVFSFLGADTLSLFRVGRHPISEIVTAMTESFAEFNKKLELPMNVHSITIDNNNNTELQYSVYVMCVEARDLPNKPVAYHSYLIEQSGKPLAPEIRNVGGQQIELMRLPSDANDAVLRELVEKAVMAKFPGQPIVQTASEVVPKSFKLDDNNALWMLYVNGILACRQGLDAAFNSTDMNLSKASKDSSLIVRVERNTSEVKTTSGLPCRSDVVMTTIARSLMQSVPGSVNTQRTDVMAQVTGFTDFIWVKKPTPAAGPWGQPQAVQPGQNLGLYQPLFVITNMMPEAVQSLPAQLLTLATAGILNEDRRWTFSMLPRKGTGRKRETNIHDIGAVGYDANFQGNPDGVGARIEGTDKDDFTLGKLNDLLSMVASPELLFAVDVPECGSTSWQHGIFAAASEGNKAAIDDIVAAADYLTNGNFKKFWQGGQVCFNYGGRIHMGYYHTNDRGMCDLRDIDYLAVANLIGDRDMNTVRRWSESFNNESVDLAVRLQWRKAILDTLSPEYTGWGRRVVFSGHFMQALGQACSAAGLVLKPELPYSDVSSDVRTTASFVPNAIVGTPMHTGLFSTGTTSTNTNFYNSAYNGYVVQSGAAWGGSTL